MRTATIMLTTALLLGSASVAAAHDTAWVLWEKDVMTDRIDWKTLAAFESRSKCIQNVQPFIVRKQAFLDQIYAKSSPKKTLTYRVEKHPGGYSLNAQSTKGGFLNPLFEFTCLPGTLDPREKK